jgi:nucleoid-associated protein YgaU
MAAAKPAAAAKPVMAALPTKPKPARPLQGDSGDDMPTLNKPRVETPKAPARHVAVAHATKPTSHLAKPENADPMAAAARQTAMALPAKPRKPMQVAEAPEMPPVEEGTPDQHEPVTIAVPHNVPKAAHHAASGGGRGYYQVKPGDSLSKLARRYLGSAKRWPELYAMNRGRVSDPALIRVGQVLALPGASTASGRGRTYVVRPGDSLFKIAGSQMGNGSRWHSIYQANRGSIRDARMIFPGQKLYLPV